MSSNELFLIFLFLVGVNLLSLLFDIDLIILLSGFEALFLKESLKFILILYDALSFFSSSFAPTFIIDVFIISSFSGSLCSANITLTYFFNYFYLGLLNSFEKNFYFWFSMYISFSYWLFSIYSFNLWSWFATVMFSTFFSFSKNKKLLALFFYILSSIILPSSVVILFWVANLWEMSSLSR